MTEDSIRIPLSEELPDLDQLSSIYLAGDFAISTIDDDATLETFFSESVLKDVRESDFSFVNYEGVTAKSLDPIFKGGPLVEIHERCPGLLAEAGFTGVTLANNHTVDYGPEGIRQTINRCREKGLKTLGAGTNITEAITPSRFSNRGSTISIFNVSEQPIHSYALDEAKPCIADIAHPKIIQKIIEEKEKNTFILCIAHAGEIGVPLPPVQLQRRYRRLIDLGVDIIVGHHPHVSQGWERYKEGMIFYSLGNYLFEFGRSDRPEYEWGLSLRIWFDEEGPQCVDVIPVEDINRCVYHLGQDQSRNRYFKRLQQMTNVFDDDERFSLMWMVIASKLHADREREFIDAEKFLNMLVWDSHRSTIETALINRAIDIEIQSEIAEHAFAMWRWTSSNPYHTSSTKWVTKLVKTIYRGPIRYVSTKMGVDTYLYKLYIFLLNALRNFK